MSYAENTNALSASQGAGDNTMGQSKFAQAVPQSNSEDGVNVIVNNYAAEAPGRTAKQFAADWDVGKEHVHAWAERQDPPLPYVTIAKQRVYLVADVKDAIRRAGKIAPTQKAPKKTPPAPKMSALEIAQAAGISFVKGGTT